MQFYVCFRAIWNLEAINDDKTENIEKKSLQLDLEVTLHAQIFNF